MYESSSESYIATVFETGTPGNNIGIVSWTQGETHNVKIVGVICFNNLLTSTLTNTTNGCTQCSMAKM